MAKILFLDNFHHTNFMFECSRRAGADRNREWMRKPMNPTILYAYLCDCVINFYWFLQRMNFLCVSSVNCIFSGLLKCFMPTVDGNMCVCACECFSYFRYLFRVGVPASVVKIKIVYI